MMNAANIPQPMKYILFREVFKTSTLLDGLTVATISQKTATRFEHWNGKLPAFAHHLRVWDEAGVVTLKTEGQNVCL